MEDRFVVRWLVQIDEARWLMYDDKDDIEDWDTILEVRLPREMALMLDYTQHAYFQMQGYFEAQWESMMRLLAEDVAEYDEAGSGDDNMFTQAFEDIIKKNGLDELGKEE